MAEHYRANFMIEGPEARGLPLLERVAAAARGWAWEQFGRPEADVPVGEWRSEQGTLRSEKGRLEESGFFALSWERPTGWLLDVRLATQGEAVEAEAEVQGPSESGDLHAGPPQALFDALLDRFECRIDERTLSTQAARMKPKDAPSFVRDTVFGRERRIPLVVVTADRFGRSAASADYLQARLLGLARVVAYDGETAEAVNRELETPVVSEAGHPLIRVNNRVHEQIGEGTKQAGWRDYYKWLDAQLGCFAGAVRVYAPGCSEGDASWKHQYWPMERIRTAGRDFWLELRDACMSRSLLWTGPRMYDAVVQRIDRLEREALLKQQRQSSETEDLLNAWQEKLNEYENRDVEHQQARARLELGAREKDAQIQRLMADNHDLSRQLRDPDIGSAVEESYQDWVGSPAKQDTLLGAVREAKKLNGLRFLPSTSESAKGSPYRGPRRLQNLQRVFGKMSECAQTRAQGKLGKPVAEWFADEKVDYAPFESEATMNRFGDQRLFFDGDRLVEMQEHIKLGKGGPEKALRIHFCWSDDEKVWLVGHVGRHLDIVSSG